jgi:hypothetical protein
VKTAKKGRKKLYPNEKTQVLLVTLPCKTVKKMKKKRFTSKKIHSAIENAL